MSFNVAIDGPAGAGKSTVAKSVAALKNFIYVDTGAMYRAMALYFLRKGIDKTDESAINAALGQVEITIRYEKGAQQVILNGENVSGLIRTEADELTYSLHVLVRYELEKRLIEEDLDVNELPKLWADKYEEYLGIRPETDAQGVLQDIHWAQGSFGYFPSYALGSAFGTQMLFQMKKEMDFDRLLEEGKLDVIREYLRKHVHRYGKMKDSREILKDMTGEDFNPKYYVEYLEEKYRRLYAV